MVHFLFDDDASALEMPADARDVQDIVRRFDETYRASVAFRGSENARMELRHLRYFVAVVEEENFHRAAEKLHVSQSPLSRQVQQLRAELGVDLFEASGRGVKLTSAGRTFLEIVREARA